MFDSNIQISVNLHDHMVELDDDMEWNYSTINFPPLEFYAAVDEIPDFSTFDDEPLSPQFQIRNHDCMWSGRCTTHPNECLSNRSSCNTKYMNEKSTPPQQQQQNAQQTQSNALNQQSQQQCVPSLLNSQQQQQQQQTKTVQQIKKQSTNVPAGQSLLRLKHPKPTVIKIPNMSTNDFLKDRDYIARPDTPLSLDDDPPEFKHTIDIVAACTMGSNEMSLIKTGHESSPTEIINILKEHLEDSSNRITPKIPYISSMKSDSDGLEDILNDIKTFSDFENDSDDDEADESDTSNTSNDSFNVSNTMIALPTQSPPQSQASLLLSSSSSAKNSASVYDITQSMYSDHSYTRSKARVDVIGLGVQTPSDSGNVDEFSIFCFYLLFLCILLIPLYFCM